MRPVAARALHRAAHSSRPSSIASRSYASVRDPLQKDPAELDEITELPNGVRVATESLPGPFSGIGVYVDAGSRYEDESLRGVGHIVDRLAFKSTNLKSADAMLESLEMLGGNVQCASSREAMMYQSAVFNSAVPTAVGLLAETIREPQITEAEVQSQLETAEYEISEIWSKPDLILPELVHMAAYKDNTLGHPLLCPRERLPLITSRLIQKYRGTFYKPERIVVAFAGVQHQEALRLAEQYFGDMRRDEGPFLSQSGSETTVSDSSWPSSPSSSRTSSSSSSSSTTSSSTPSYHPSQPAPSTSKILSKLPLFKSLSTSAAQRATVLPLDPALLQSKPDVDLHQVSRYTGGFASLPPIPAPLNNLSIPLSHVHIAFEACGISSDDIYALATLQTLLGGGGSFSAGGPGKGMYSRLYTHVLNQHGWVESCHAFNHSYSDSGLFGISASCVPGKVGSMIDVMCRELQALTLDTGFSALQTAEVNRAKNQLRSSLLMNLESRLVELEDLGRQVQVHGKKVGSKEMCAKIEALTVNDLRRVAKEMLSGQVKNPGNGSGAPTVVIQEGLEAGKSSIKQLSWEEVSGRIAKWKLGRM